MTKDYNNMRVRCEKVANLYGNPSPSNAAACVMADAADRPAFWTSAAFGSVIDQVAWQATAGGELYLALANFNLEFDPLRKEILDGLIPLNHKAVLQLRMAYMSINQFPPIPKLWARQEKRA